MLRPAQWRSTADSVGHSDATPFWGRPLYSLAFLPLSAAPGAHTALLIASTYLFIYLVALFATFLCFFRYNLAPGHLWDGVDRSNGFEKKYFKLANQQAATNIDAYKWSTENM